MEKLMDEITGKEEGDFRVYSCHIIKFKLACHSMMSTY